MDEKIISVTLPFPTSESAALACEVLNVDKELKKSEIHRDISTQGASLLIVFHGKELKRLRVALNAILKNVILIAKTIDQFKN